MPHRQECLCYLAANANTDTTGYGIKNECIPEGCQKLMVRISGIPPGCGFPINQFPVVSLANPRLTTG
jgi:hypothetical protein